MKKSFIFRAKMVLVRLICLLIPDRKLRKAARDYLKDFRFVDLITARRFRRCQVGQRTVLIIEINPCHGEILPGYIDYFRRLNYDVDVLINETIACEHPFARMNIEECRVFTTLPTCFPLFITSTTLSRYACVFIATTKYYNHLEGNPAVIEKYPALLNHRKLLGVEHDVADIAQLHEEALVCSNRLITLGRFNKGAMVNPHRFGRVAITPKGSPTRFLVVGALGLSRDGLGLIEALQKVVKKSTAFEVVVAGEGSLIVPPELEAYVQLKGRVSFEALYEEVEKCSFILALLDPANPQHIRYRTTSMTGTAQLSYGFRKPVLIHQDFAKKYGFSPSNALVYKTDLAEALHTAIEMSQPEYARMQEELGQLAETLYLESLSNLRHIMEGDLS
jgi:hypothetical protein